jgi:superfamily II DNA or RNA helicase
VGRSKRSFEGPSDESVLAIAYLLAGGEPPRSVASFAMAAALRSSGFEWRAPLPRLAARLIQIAKHAPGFEVDAAFVRALSPGAIVACLAPLERLVRTAPAARRPRRPRGRRPGPEPAARGAPRRGPQEGARDRSAIGRPRPQRAASSASATAAAPPPAAEPALPAPAAPAPVEAVMLPAPLEAWAARADAVAASLAEVSLALRGRLIAHASAFRELLGLTTLRGVEMLPYQIETVRRVLRVLRGRALLADEVGLGKTVEALMVLREYQLRGMVRRALILAPPALTRHWRGELESKAGIEALCTDDARFRDDPAGFWRERGVVIASLAIARSARHAPLVQAEQWDLVVVDEAHHLKNRATLAHRLVNGLKSRFLLLLTATPVETDLEEIFNLVTLLAPGQLTTPAEFRRAFVDPKDPSRPKDAERLRRLLGEVMVRNTRAQSGLALPPRFVETIAVDPLPEERAAYEEVVALLREHADSSQARLAAATLLLEAGSSPAAVLATLEKIASSATHDGALRADAGRIAPRIRTVTRCRKLEALLRILGANPDPVLVFTRYRRTAEYVATAARALGLKAESFHGGMSSAERHAAVERFRAGARLLVATDVGAEGQNLQFCQTLVNFDLPWNPAQIEQRIGRLHRMGQTGEVRVFNLCSKGTVEDRVLDVLDRRLHLFELVVGEMDMVLGNLGDERDLEERILALYAESRSEGEVAAGFDRIANELAAARGLYERSRALDEALFQRDFEA